MYSPSCESSTAIEGWGGDVLPLGSFSSGNGIHLVGATF